MKIIEKIIEPYHVERGSTFKLKIKAIRYATYNELKENFYYDVLKDYKYKTLKGD